MRSVKLLLVALCAAAGGCSTPVGKYFARRAADLRDCVEAEVGLGWPVAPFLFPRATGYSLEPTSGKPIVERKPRWHMLLRPHVYVRAKLTDFFVLGNGYAEPVCYGWRGRYRAAGSTVALAEGLPFYHSHEEIAGTTVHTDWMVLTQRSYDAAKPGPGGRLAESCWAGFSATLLVALRLELNLVELADFLVGFSTYDLLGDDTWERREEKR